MKTIKLLLLTLLMNSPLLRAQIPINTSIYGQNAWYITGSSSSPTDLDPYWPDIKASGVKYVRIGGIDANFNPLYDFNTSLAITNAGKLIYLINKIRTNGMEPIIQVGYNPVCTTIGTFTTVSQSGPSDQATIAGNLVDYFNNATTGYYKTNPIKYWIIANEPDLFKNCVSTDLKGYGWDGNTSTAACTTPSACAGLISGYIKAFSTAMKGKDPTIKIIAPEFSGFNNDANFSVNKIMQQLVSPTTNPNSVMGTISAGVYYVDTFQKEQFYLHLFLHKYLICKRTDAKVLIKSQQASLALF